MTRLLAKAIEEGIVEIKVHLTESVFPDLEIALEEKFGFNKAWISPNVDDKEQNLKSLGLVGAECLVSLLGPKAVVTVGLSTTLEYIPPHLPNMETGATFVPGLGSLPGGALSQTHAHEIAGELADRLGGFSHHLPAPFVMASADAAKMMRAEPEVYNALKLAREASIALYGVGGLRKDSGPLVPEITASGEIVDLLKKGAVGDISGIYVDTEGNHVPSGIERRIISLSIEEIRKINSRVIVAAGDSKVDVLLALSKNGLITDLVTDRRTAELVLARSDTGN